MNFGETGLPVVDSLAALRQALESTPNAVLVAPPGAGKTTLVPLALLEAPWRGGGHILLLEPRRLAARAAARRMASLLREQPGGRVGYRMRLDSRIGAETVIEVVTEGVFQRMILDDPALDGVACVIFDEFHERSLDADLSLALCLDAQAGLREDLRLLVMSATLDDARVAGHVGGPVIESLGRSFPVETRYRPRGADERIEAAVASAVRETLQQETGSILAFLPGQAEIARTLEALSGRVPADTDLVPLHGALGGDDQDRAIRPAEPGRRKVVLATAIAESSVTIDGVRIVIDSGLSRRPAFEPGMAMTRLETVRVSRASADQRAGRAGRTQPGIAIRLWAQGQTAALAPFDPPEIARSDLTRLLLDCRSWGVSDPCVLPFLDKPPEPALAEARRRLTDLGAIDATGAVTPFGKTLTSIALPVPLAAMVASAPDRRTARRASRLAVLISERGLGGMSVDLDRRLDAFDADRSTRAKAARGLADRLADTLGKRDADAQEAPASAGVLLLGGFPERVAMARPGQPGRFVMANGRGLVSDEAGPLALSAFIVAADASGAAAGAKLLAGATVTREDIEMHLSRMISERLVVTFDRKSRALAARLERSLGALRLSSSPRPVEPGPETVAALVAALQVEGLALLPADDRLASLRERLEWLGDHAPGQWSACDEATLAAEAGQWLAPWLAGLTSFRALSTDAVCDALLARAGLASTRDLDRLLPEYFEAPTGSRIRLDYGSPGQAPALRIRVQELFGTARHPAILDGAVPLTVELLSPAMRPIQRTTDLPAFWSGSWRDVRADMRGRYPRHEWPDDPANAAPTRRTKPR